MKHKIDLIEGDTVRGLLSMVLPLVAAMILTMAYNLVDSLWVGNLLGEAGYAALTSSTAIVLILSAVAMGCGNGAAILVSQEVGARRTEEADRTIATILLLACGFALAVTVVLELALDPLLRLLGTPAASCAGAHAYLSVYLIGYPAIFLYMQITSLFRSFGDPVFQMKGMLFTTVFNAVVDPLMILALGLAGAAWATVLSEVLCMLYSVWYHRRRRLFRLSLRMAAPALVRPVLRCAVPSAVQQCMPAISSAAMLFLLTRYGVTTIAAYGVANRVEILLFYPAMAMNMALTTIAGQCFGAARSDRARAYLRAGLLLGCAATAVTTALVVGFAGRLSGFFLDSAQAAAIVQHFFRIVAIGYVLYMATSCFLGVLSGAGRPGLSMLSFFLYYIVLRIPLAALLVRTAMGLDGIWTAILLSHALAALIAGAFAHGTVGRAGRNGHRKPLAFSRGT